ncbi:MAG: BspA family leucine-rich repeat surface protein, partial [Clostridia bacterium]|nr:BspA family leucine-rich repeat surface protein [Clostridia bacterium]
MNTSYNGMKRLWFVLIAMLLVCSGAFGAMAESSAVPGGTNDLDGSKIEGIKVVWVTQDSQSTAEGAKTPQAELDNKEHLYLSTVGDGEMEMVYRIEAEFSGQYDYAPGDITITIPAQVWYGRQYEETGTDGETVGVVDPSRLLGTLELPVPAAPSKRADFNWQIIDGNYVLTNTRTIGATSSVSIEVGICGIRPVDVVDMSETAPITAHVEVVTNQGNTIELTSTPITAQLDTLVKITSAYKDGEVFEDYPGLDEKLLSNLPEGADPQDYIYVRWYTYHSHHNNQPYSLDIEDVLSDAYEKVAGENGEAEKKYVPNGEGIFLGSTNYNGQVLTDGEIDFTAEIGDHFTNTTTGTQYANTVYMWSAYRKDAFEVPNANEAPRVYYFENEVIWTLTETDKAIADTGNEKGEDPQKVTTARDEVVIPYAPVKWQRPRGAFAVNKWTERITYKDWLYGYALNLLESRDEVEMDFIVETVGYGYPWTSALTKGFDYEALNNTVVNGDLDSLELDADAFGKLGWKQVTDDFQTFFNFETTPLTAEDFEFKSLRISAPQKMRYAKKSNGTWDYVSDSTLPNPDLVIEYQLNNEDTWYPAATATWGEDGLGKFAFVNVNEASGVTTSGMTVIFPENVTDTRHTFVSNVFGGKTAAHCDIAMLDWYVYPTITMKSSDRVYNIVQQLFEESENPATKFRNDVIMDAYGWVDEEGNGTLVLDNDFDYSMATYEGASYGVSLTKKSTSESDPENQRLVIHYTATLTEQSNLKERSDYDAAVEAGVIPAEKSGVWYDLLPPHVVPLTDTVKLRKNDTVTNVYTVENYKNSGRTLLVVEAELTPAPVHLNNIGYADCPVLEFDAAYTWMDMDEYGKDLVNYVAFQSTVENLRSDTLGTIRNQKGDPDTPAGGNNANTPSMPREIIDALTDLDPNTDENRFVYGKSSHTVSALTYAVSGLQKAVKNDLVGIWTQGLDGQEQVTVYEGHYYTYSLRVSSAENTSTKGIVIYDTIENYIIPDPAADKDTDATKAADFAHTQARTSWTGDWQGKGQWRGTLEQVDLSEFVNAGVKPTLLYSTIPGLQFADSSSESTDDNFDEDTELFSTGSYDITDRSIWQVAQLDEKGLWQVPAGLEVTAVAIDATTTTDGNEFVLRPEEALAGYLKMRAPDDESSEDKWNAKGAYARLTDEQGEFILDENGRQQIDWEAAMDETNNMYAYNNARVRLIQGQSTEGGTNWLSNYRMIRNDYTRVGIVPEIITVEKTWQDQDNHDAMRPENVSITVLRRLAGTAGAAQPVLDAQGQPLSAVLDESNGWKAEFKQTDIVNEDGVRYLYTFRETPVDGYTSKVQFIDVNHYTMINVHPNEQVELSGVKVWDDNNDALGLRPETVTLKLYRDGEHIDTRTVKPNGAGEWNYTFGKLDKYAQGGREYEYKIEEEYVPKYVGESDGYGQVNNTYVPTGSLEVSKTLVNATAAAKQQMFTFTLVLLAEQTDPAAPAVPLMEKYPYTIYTLQGEEWTAGETGEIGNSGTFRLMEGQKIVVENLPSESTYEVIETETAGFTCTATDASGAIRAGQTAQAAFVNEYQSAGAAQLPVGKKLTGHAIRKNQFRFELVDNNPDSATYGEVIRTARVDAPAEDATTGGSGETIESLTQAIFGQLEYTQADDGRTYNYQVREVDTGKPGYTTDTMQFNVSVQVADNGDGTMTVTPAYTDRDGNAVTELKFENTYEAQGELTLKAWKTLEGRPLKDGEFTFELYSYDAAKNGLGEKLGEATNDAEGNIVFDALHFDENDVSLDENNPATYTYLIREKQGTDKTVTYSNQEYVITVSVFDNGDGTLSFAQGSQQAVREYVECPHCLGTGYEKYRFILYETDKVMGGGALGGWTSDATRTGNYVSRMPFCIVCNGTTQVGENWCDHCGGSGIELGGTFYFNYKHLKYEYVILRYENTRTVSSSSTFTGPVVAVAETETQYKYLQIDNTSESGKKNFVICPDCNGAGVVGGKMTITGDVTIPVFANQLKPGDLTVTKQIEGEGSSNPDQTFNFTIKLTGEVPEDLDYGMAAPIPTPIPTSAPTATVTPAGKGVIKTPAPTVQPNTVPVQQPVIMPAVVKEADNTKWYHASETDLQGAAYAVLNLNEEHEDYGKLIFFRSDKDNPTDPWNQETFDLGGNKRVKDDTKKVVYYLVDEREDAVIGGYTRPWYSDSSYIQAVVVRDPIKPLNGYRFFHSLSKLRELDIAKLDTSGITDMTQMFYNCRGLTSLDLSTFDTSSVTDMRYMFNNCSGLTSLDLSTFDTSSVTSMRDMFYSCSGLTSLDLSTFDTSSVTDMSYMFNNCSGLTSLDLSTFDTSSVQSMARMFYGCSGLTSLKLNTFNTSNVTTMADMFHNCSGLTNLDLSSFDTHNVTSLGSMFYNCRSLTELDLSTFDTSKVENTTSTGQYNAIYGLFQGCINLKELDLSTFGTGSFVTMANMFSGCSGLTSLDLSGFNTSNVKSMSGMFANCSGLTEINVSTFDTSNVTNMSGMFRGCTGLTEIDVSTFNTSKVTNMFALFRECDKVSALDLGNFDTSNVTNMAEMFYNCRALSELNLSSFDTSKVQYMGAMFYFCEGFTSLDLSHFNTSNVTSFTSSNCGIFEFVRNLDYLDISGFDTSKVNTYAFMFSQTFVPTIKIGDAYKLKDPPVSSWNGQYDGRWVNVLDEEMVLTADEVFKTGNHAGTWTWYVMKYKLSFDPGEGSGSMPSVMVPVRTTYSFIPQFYRFGYDLLGFSDDGSDKVKYPCKDGMVSVYNYGYTEGEDILLTAVWQKQDINVSETGDSVTFALKAGETFTLKNLPASLAYEVWEETPAGWVLVKKVNDTGVIQPLETSEAVFTNKYEPTKAQAVLRASKLLDGKAPTGKFSFTLSENGEVLQTRENTGSGISFDPIEYTKAGAHTYTIAELRGDDTAIHYDTARYTAKVDVKDDGQGNLSSAVTYETNDGSAPVFQNTTKPGSLTITKKIRGHLTDKARAQEFTFTITLTDEMLQPWSGTLGMGDGTLTVTDGKASLTLKGGDSVTLTDIPAGLRFEIDESGELPGWFLQYVSGPSGTIQPDTTAECSFRNIYTPTGTASVQVKKELLGRALEMGEFTFFLLDETGTPVAETANGADGSVLFPQMTYNEEGSWEYTVVEAAGNDNTVEYSAQQIQVLVTAKDEKGDGTLTVTVDYSPEEKTITNEIKPGALAITKTLVSSNQAHQQKPFTFTLQLTDHTGAALNGTYTLNGTERLTVKDGTATLLIKGGETSIITGLPAGAEYSIEEKAEAGFTCISAGESGVIAPTQTAQASFTNTYAAQGTYDFRVHKTLTGREAAAGEFRFALQDEAGNELETAANNADGSVTFSSLSFTHQDTGTKTYRITELDTKAAGVTYDKTVQEIVLTITDNGDGTLTVEDNLDGQAAEFTNVYNDKTAVHVEKIWQDENNLLGMRPDSVTVVLYRNGEQQAEQVLNGQNGWKHTFADLAAFDEDGVTYTYTVKEAPVSGYDSMLSARDGVQVFTNTVQGVLDVSKTVEAGLDNTKAFAFTVTLTRADAPLTAPITLVKDGASSPLTPDQDGKVYFSLKNGEKVRLTGLPIGTKYLVEEAPEAGYTATAENAEGIILRYEAHHAAFTNTYAATGSIRFTGEKTVAGAEPAEDEVFTFQLKDAEGNMLQEVENEDGLIPFAPIDYTLPDVDTTFVYTIAESTQSSEQYRCDESL